MSEDDDDVEDDDVEIVAVGPPDVQIVEPPNKRARRDASPVEHDEQAEQAPVLPPRPIHAPRRRGRGRAAAEEDEEWVENLDDIPCRVRCTCAIFSIYVQYLNTAAERGAHGSPPGAAHDAAAIPARVSGVGNCAGTKPRARRYVCLVLPQHTRNAPHRCAGLLADEMGMGKTIQAISLIVTHRSDDMARIELPAGTAVNASNEDVKPKIKLRVAGAPPPPTVPMPVLLQAEMPVEETEAAHDVPAVDAEEAALPPPCQHDDLKKHISSSCKKYISADPMAFSDPTQAAAAVRSTANEHCCGDSAGPSTSAVLPAWCKATLVICPLVAVIQWRGEIARYTAPGSVKVCWVVGRHLL